MHCMAINMHQNALVRWPMHSFVCVSVCKCVFLSQKELCSSNTWLWSAACKLWCNWVHMSSWWVP